MHENDICKCDTFYFLHKLLAWNEIPGRFVYLMSIGFIENLAGEDEDVEDDAETVEDREGDHQPQEARLGSSEDEFSFIVA